MLKAIEVGLLTVSILVFLGLIVTGPVRRRSRIAADSSAPTVDDSTHWEGK